MGSRKPTLVTGMSRLVPCAVRAFKDVHALIEREVAHEVRSPRRRDSDLGLGHSASLGVLDDSSPACELLFLRAVEVAAGEYVAEVSVQEGPAVLDGEGWHKPLGALVGPAVYQEGRVDDVGIRREPLQHLFDPGHLGRVTRADERSDDDPGQSGLAEGVQEADLVVDGDACGLDLHPLAHGLVAVLDGGPVGVHGVSCRRCGGLLGTV